jgi:uridine phosphorylase
MSSELILNADNTIYHLGLLPEQIAETIILVGDPDRVGEVSKHFDRIEHQVAKREFVTHTGELRGTRISVVSTGIGTDNVDIVLNELDALHNLDLATAQPKTEQRALRIVRIGTSGSIQSDLAVDTLLISDYGVGLDLLMQFYDLEYNTAEMSLADDLMAYLEGRSELLVLPYAVQADRPLMRQLLADDTIFVRGNTVTCPGFYAPQGRITRGRTTEPKLLEHLTQFKSKFGRLTNMEMETAGIYGLARLLGHQAVSCNAILANRVTGEFSQNPQATIERLIEIVLKRLIP